MTERIAVTACDDRFPVVDRHGVRVHVGDTLRVRHCVGPYGQTAETLHTVQNAHWLYGSDGPVTARYDYDARVMRCAYVHTDPEHSHEVWAEVCDG